MPVTKQPINVTLSGNTTSGGAGLINVSTGTMTLAGGNNITLSQDGNAVTISGANVGGAQTAISGLANSETTYTSGTVNLSVVAGNMTIRSTTGQAFQFSLSQSVQPETQTFVGGIGNSQTTYTSGTVNLSVVAGNLTIRSTTGNAFQFSASQSVQAETQTFVGGIGNSETTYTSGTVNLSVVGGNMTIRSTTGNAFQFSASEQNLSVGLSTGGNTQGNTTVNTGSRLVFVGTNNITLSQGTAAGATTISISGPNAGAETQTAISGLANSETTYTSGSVTLSALGAITIRSTTGQHFQFSVNSQSTQTQGILSAGVSTGGNTAGNTTVNTGSRLVFVGSNMISLSQGTAAGASTITLNATQSVQAESLSLGVSTGGNSSGDTGVNTGTRLVLAGGNNITLSQGTAAGATTITISAGAGGAGMSAGVSTGGNTSGDTGAVTGRLVLAGGNNITLSGSTNAGSMTVTISAPNLGAGAMSVGVSNLGNTAGSTGATGTRLALVGTHALTLSQSTDANGGTVTIQNPAPLIHWNPWQYQLAVTAAHQQNTIHIQPYPFPHAVQFDRMVFPASYSQATNSTLTVSASISAAFYTKNGSTLSMLNSSTGLLTINGSGTASSANNSGLRNWTMGWVTTMSIGNYWLAFAISTATAGNNASISLFRHSVQSSAYSGLMGVASNRSAQVQLGLGDYSASSGAFPASIHFNQIDGSGTLAQRRPMIWFVSETV